MVEENLHPLLPNQGPSVIIPPAKADFGRYMNVKEVADYLRISKFTVYAMISKRQIPFIEIGRSKRFDREVIDLWMRKKRIGTVSMMEN